MFRSYDNFISRIDEMIHNQSLWMGKRFLGDVEETFFPLGVKYWARDSLAILQEILENKSLTDKCVWSPRKIINSAGERVDTDLHDTDWWWNVQVASFGLNELTVDPCFTRQPS